MALTISAFAYAAPQDSGTNAELAKIMRMLTSYSVTADYSYTADKLSGKGTLVFNGQSYRFSGSGMQVYCDGTTVWTVDTKAKEVYVDSAGSTNSLLADPGKALEYVTTLHSDKDSITGTAKNPSGHGTVNFKVQKIVKGPLTSDMKQFRFSTAGLGKDWVVTDLRTGE